jgi:hypothetical protein
MRRQSSGISFGYYCPLFWAVNSCMHKIKSFRSTHMISVMRQATALQLQIYRSKNFFISNAFLFLSIK